MMYRTTLFVEMFTTEPLASDTLVTMASPFYARGRNTNVDWAFQNEAQTKDEILQICADFDLNEAEFLGNEK